jgi:hypothetical protein
VGRMRTWIVDDATREAQSLGDRLWLLEHGNNPWFPIEVARRTRRFLPEAHIEEVEDGPLTRPDITAAVVRKLTRPAEEERLSVEPSALPVFAPKQKPELFWQLPDFARKQNPGALACLAADRPGR